jgi:acyl-CoA hydrolase
VSTIEPKRHIPPAGETGLPVKYSQVEMTEMVLPNDTNTLGNLLGGRLMHWIDLAAAIAGQRHAKTVVVTASVDELNFLHPIKIAEVVILRASVNRVFKTSMEVGVKVYSQNLKTGESKHANSAYLTFVALDENGRPTTMHPVIPEDEEEHRRFREALERRDLRLQHRKHRKKTT